MFARCFYFGVMVAHGLIRMLVIAFVFCGIPRLKGSAQVFGADLVKVDVRHRCPLLRSKGLPINRVLRLCLWSTSHTLLCDQCGLLSKPASIFRVDLFAQLAAPFAPCRIARCISITCGH